VTYDFQAEDGIRDSSVTGVQTCALPISPAVRTSSKPPATQPQGRSQASKARRGSSCSPVGSTQRAWHLRGQHGGRCRRQRLRIRSEERRVGKEGGGGWGGDEERKKGEGG